MSPIFGQSFLPAPPMMQMMPQQPAMMQPAMMQMMPPQPAMMAMPPQPPPPSDSSGNTLMIVVLLIVALFGILVVGDMMKWWEIPVLHDLISPTKPTPTTLPADTSSATPTSSPTPTLSPTPAPTPPANYATLFTPPSNEIVQFITNYPNGGLATNAPFVSNITDVAFLYGPWKDGKDYKYTFNYDLTLSGNTKGTYTKSSVNEVDNAWKQPGVLVALSANKLARAFAISDTNPAQLVQVWTRA